MMGIASGAALSACNVNNADKKLIPYLVPPEEGVIPGVPRYANSTCMECPAQCGVSVKIRDDKPVKLEGNPNHPINKGALCVRGQSSLARLYHPERLKQPVLNGKPVSWEEAAAAFNSALEESAGKGQRNIFLSSRTTGTLGQLIDEFCTAKGFERLKEVEIYHQGSIKNANKRLLNQGVTPHYLIREADVLLTVGADILETFISPVEWTQQLAEARQKNLRHWFHVEPYLTLTGAAADHRNAVEPGSEPYLLAYLLHHIDLRSPLPDHILKQVPDYTITHVAEVTGLDREQIEAVATALQKSNNPLVICGGVSARAIKGNLTALYTTLLHWGMGMVGKTVDFGHVVNDENTGTINHLMESGKDLDSGKIGVAVFSRFNLPDTMTGFMDSLKKAAFKVAIAAMPSAFSQSCDLVLPLSHTLESWGDAEPRKGIKSIVQPVIKPLHDTRSEGDILLYLMGSDAAYRDYLSNHWQGLDESWIEKGYWVTPVVSVTPQLNAGATLALPEPVEKKDILFVTPSLRTFDGRSADIALLEEIPDPLTSVSYGKWLTVSLEIAKKLDLAPGDVVQVSANNTTFKLPVIISPGLPGGVVTLSIDALPEAGLSLMVELDGGEFMTAVKDISLAKTGERFKPLALSGGKKTGKRGILPPHLEKEADDHGHHHEHKKYTLYPPHEHENYRWAMVIDLDACTGCSACVAACYIENNIPVVGEDEHRRGREMAWLRIEPYYNDPNQPEFIPMMCQQCDHAPCETVCPVYATYHNKEGLNAQVYNRCVGTRYCANNCPYKARRFNWFDNEEKQPLYKVHNPDLSVRPKGVMEKCTFCFQRIRYAKDQAKDKNRLVQDGEVTTACAQTCPARAITFGNLDDPNSEVSKLAKSEGAYRVQELLGTEPAVYYIKRKKKS